MSGIVILNPGGFCECGCGLKTPIAEKTIVKNGRVKGYVTKLLEQRRSYQGQVGQRPRSPVDYVVDETTGCWVWHRRLAVHGYGTKLFNGKAMGAHRVYYIKHKGPISDGLELDHLCRNKACVNPDHLEPVTRQENMRRMLERRRMGQP